MITERLDLSGKNLGELLELLGELCKTHDWYYTMADDSRAYHSGLAHADKINHVRGVIDAMGAGAASEAIMSIYRPAPLGH